MRPEDLVTLSYDLSMFLPEQNSLSVNKIPTVALVNFIHILLLSVSNNTPGTVATWIVCLSARSEGRTWYTTHRGRLWIAATVKQPDPKEIRENEEFYRRLHGGRSHIVCTPPFLELLHSPFLPSWNGESGPNGKLEMGIVLWWGYWRVVIYSSDVWSHTVLRWATILF